MSPAAELAHGILPVGLLRGGLGGAVDGLVSRLELPVDVGISTGRLPGDVEASAYFIVAEALTNVVKHAGATRAQVTATLIRTACASRCATTAWAAPTRGASASSASPTGSTRWGASCESRAETRTAP